MTNELQDVYNATCADLHDLGRMTEGLVRALLTEEGLRPHSVAHRIKTQQSVRRKLDSRGWRTKDLDEMHDLLGLRIITFFPDEVDQVAKVIKRHFEIDDENSVDKRSLLDPDRFGYLSLHYVATLNRPRLELTENARFTGRKFEIQIRSILQHAWAEIEHDLGYHATQAIPDAVRRRFSRLAGLLEIADDEFERLREDVAQYQAVVGEEVLTSPSEVQIDRDSIAALIASDPVVGRLDAELAQITGLPTAPSHEQVPNIRAEELSVLGFETIGQIVRELEEHEALLKAFYRRWAERRDVEYVYSGLVLFILGYLVVAGRGKADLLWYLEKMNIRDESEDRLTFADAILASYSDAVTETRADS